jgi:DNA-binding GntR family transcriptional regulator
MIIKVETPLREKAYNKIKEIIIEEDQETHISLRKTAEKLDMSITPVREAFQSLEREGLLNSIPNIGYFIPNYTKNDVIEIFQTRECMEIFVLDKVFNKLNEEDIKSIEYYLEKQKDFYDKNDIFKHFEMDEKFHLIFFNIYDNSYLTQLIKKVREQYAIIIIKSIKQSMIKEKEAKVIEEHYEILEALKSGDKNLTKKKMLEHIENARNRAINILGGRR